MYEGLPSLSRVEKRQLGTFDGAYNFVTAEEWAHLRPRLTERSLALNPLLDDSSMTAYTPGETYYLLKNSKVRKWHEYVGDFVADGKYETIILVPCVKTKPWSEEHSKRSSLYRAYHKIISLSSRGQLPPAYFATVSEPLGIVPQEHWSDFPQYDNPGLFRDYYLRTGLMKADLVRMFGERKLLPFDEQKYQECIKTLGGVAARFLENHADRRILSFVDANAGQGTHEEIVDVAISKHSGTEVKRYKKRESTRSEPVEHIVSKLVSVR